MKFKASKRYLDGVYGRFIEENETIEVSEERGLYLESLSLGKIIRETKKSQKTKKDASS